MDAEENGRVTGYDALGRPTTFLDARGGVTELGYDDRDNVIAVTDPEGNTTVFDYDAADRKISETRPMGEVRSYGYYADGLRKRETNAKGEITFYSYDDAGQLTDIDYYTDQTALDNGQSSRHIDFTYNALGQVASYSDPDTSSTYTYDDLGRLETVTVDYGPFTKSHSYTYYDNGRRKTYTNPENITYTYNYMPNGDFQSLSIPGEGVISVTEYKWRQPTKWAFPGGTTLNTGADDLLRPQTIAAQDPAGNGFVNRSFTYDRENHVTGITTEDGSHLYTLDELYRLTLAQFQQIEQLEDEAYTYDKVGNRLTENGGAQWQYNANNELMSTPEASFTYDANGHTTSKTENGQTTNYSYNLAERLSSVAIDGGATLGTYAYDPFGRRIKKVTSEGTRYFHYDDTGLLAVYDGSGNLLEEYQYRPGSPWMTNPLFKRDGGSGMHYYVNDHLGRSLYMFDASGRVTWKGRSQAFGETVVEVEVVENNLRFPGQYYDGETGLNYNYSRYYHSTLGRYIQRDHIGLKGGVNTFVYSLNNPGSFYDDDAELAHLFLGAACGVLAGLIERGGDFTVGDLLTDAAYGAGGAVLGDLITGTLGGIVLGGGRAVQSGQCIVPSAIQGGLSGAMGDSTGFLAENRRQIDELSSKKTTFNNKAFKRNVGGVAGCITDLALSAAKSL